MRNTLLATQTQQARSGECQREKKDGEADRAESRDRLELDLGAAHPGHSELAMIRAPSVEATQKSSLESVDGG